MIFLYVVLFVIAYAVGTSRAVRHGGAHRLCGIARDAGLARPNKTLQPTSGGRLGVAGRCDIRRPRLSVDVRWR